jgi:hypothetical protein
MSRERHKSAGWADHYSERWQAGSASARGDCDDSWLELGAPAILQHESASETAAVGQPQPHDHLTPAWLLSAAGGNVDPAQAADAKGRQSSGLRVGGKNRESARQLTPQPLVHDVGQARRPHIWNRGSGPLRSRAQFGIDEQRADQFGRTPGPCPCVIP